MRTIRSARTLLHVVSLVTVAACSEEAPSSPAPDSAPEESAASALAPTTTDGSGNVTLQAEDFDKGRAGVAYRDTDSRNVGGEYRQTGVDLKKASDAGGGYAVGWVQPGEWLRYTIELPVAGTYALDARVASAESGRGFHVEVDGANVTGTLTVPQTGAWDTGWATVTRDGIAVAAGRHVIRVVAETESFDLNYFVFRAPTSAPTNPAPPTTPTTPTTPGATTVGPILPVGPQDGLACAGTAVKPGDDVRAMVASKPAGTTFCFGAGTYSRVQITPKTGDRFVAAKGARLDGEGATVRAFDAAGTGVTVQNFVIENYTAPPQQGAVAAGVGWTVQNNEVTRNAGCGVLLATDSRVLGNYLHHNAQEGYCGGHIHGAVLDSNEIAFNNPDDAVDPGWEAGGGKFGATEDMVISHNYSHDNHGPGLWTDIDNVRISYLYNRVEDNAAGIFHEISYDAIIKGNLLRNNAVDTYCPGWLWCAGIQIAASGGIGNGQIEISDNQVYTRAAPFPANGIALIQQDRGTGAYGEYLVRNVWVHDNRIDLSAGGLHGGIQDIDDATMFQRNNRFEHNTYNLGTNRDAFFWNDLDGEPEFWQAQGQDLTGTFL